MHSKDNIHHQLKKQNKKLVPGETNVGDGQPTGPDQFADDFHVIDDENISEELKIGADVFYSNGTSKPRYTKFKNDEICKDLESNMEWNFVLQEVKEAILEHFVFIGDKLNLLKIKLSGQG